MPAHLSPTALSIGRRRLFLGAAAAAAGAALSPGLATSVAADNNHDPLPAPNPIPGGLDIPPPIGLIHVWGAGKEGEPLPFTGGQLQGIDYEPATLTDFSGVTAVAFHVGSATDSEGTRYNLETDMRLFAGTYKAANGKRRQGAFGLI
jgi:hypothetical protein